ncbi:MAG: cytochrome c biogenesis protein CcdA, partial [Nanoarchaeota archaeon]
MLRKIFLIVFLFFLFLIIAAPALAQSVLPLGLQKIIAYNQQVTLDFSVKISFLIAFLAGMLGILSPCILPFLPAYFSYTFKEKKNITKMTLVFF